ncbi:MAG: DUF2203 domain-containing protein [Candidatus Aenigmarchaeota archaeon]|nr:DUF2203 domain-containing protein [Candidatus Aenigmarchaeota archaeon]
MGYDAEGGVFMKPHIFSVEEANAALPPLTTIVKEIMEIHDSIKHVTNGIKELFDIWNEAVHEAGNPDNKMYNEKLRERNELLERLQQRIEDIRQFGGVVKDLSVGLVDFYHEIDGELVFLCWKYGEREIRFWHRLQEGYGDRKPVGSVVTV